MNKIEKKDTIIENSYIDGDTYLVFNPELIDTINELIDAVNKLREEKE